MTSATAGSPRVSVPVLSNATARTAASRSRWAPPLISTPFRAAAESADTIDTGVEITSAHGQEMTSRTSARYSHVAGIGAADERRDNRDQDRQRNHRRRIDAREAIDERLHRRAARLRRLDQVNDARQPRIAARCG